jgi:hypothetical protein
MTKNIVGEIKQLDESDTGTIIFALNQLAKDNDICCRALSVNKSVRSWRRMTESRVATRAGQRWISDLNLCHAKTPGSQTWISSLTPPTT